VQVDYSAGNVEATSNGAKFVLTAKPPKENDSEPKLEGPDAKKHEGPDAKKFDTQTGGFRYAVFTWREPAGSKFKNPFANMAGKQRNSNVKSEFEIVAPPLASEADIRSVSDEEMAAFIKNQFVLMVDIKDVNVSRRAGVAEPEFQFDVELKGISGARGWPHTFSLLFGGMGPFKGVPLGTTLQVIEDQIVNGIGAAITLILSVVITSFFIPNLLRKGSIDLLISKPIGRAQLLVYKYVGGLTFIFLLSVVSIGGVWFILAIRSGLWDPAFLMVIPILTFTFAILYAMSTVVAVFTRSAIASILVTIGFMFVLYLVGQAKTVSDVIKIDNRSELPDWAFTLVDTLNNILPRYKDLDKLTSKLIIDCNLTVGQARASGILIEYPSWSGALGVSLAFIAIMLALSCWRLVKRDC
jgi:ABC-type transport system involved in multi-copper enzyme maturation permease subunit